MALCQHLVLLFRAMNLCGHFEQPTSNTSAQVMCLTSQFTNSISSGRRHEGVVRNNICMFCLCCSLLLLLPPQRRRLRLLSYCHDDDIDFYTRKPCYSIPTWLLQQFIGSNGRNLGVVGICCVWIARFRKWQTHRYLHAFLCFLCLQAHKIWHRETRTVLQSVALYWKKCCKLQHIAASTHVLQGFLCFP